jgi:hypothetical protein
MPDAPKEVFISYARATARETAAKLSLALGKDRAYLDTNDIPYGASFPRHIGEALLGARVVLILADHAYFESAYCMAEMRLALSTGEPYPQVVIALADDAGKNVTTSLPWPLSNENWPKYSQIADIVTLVEARLKDAPSVRDRDPARVDEVLAAVTSGLLVPPPGRLGKIPHYALSGIPTSIGDRFVGREAEIWRLHYALTSRPAAAAALSGALGGAAGFGKTRLATEYLHRFGPLHYPGGIFWLNAEAGDLELQFHGMLRELDPDAPDLNTLQQSGPQQGGVARALARAFEKVEGGRILFVADNVPEGDAFPMDHWCPGMGSVTLLATSRGAIWGLEASLPVGELPPDAARRLLTGGLPDGTTNEREWDAICQWVGYHSLALEILNGALQQGAATRSELLAASRRSGPVSAVDSKFAALASSHISGFALRGIAEALRISYDKLPGEAQRAARLIAKLAPEPIPLILLKALVPEKDLDTVRAALKTRNWITVGAQDSGETFGQMHRVLSDFLRSVTKHRKDEADEWAGVCSALVAVVDDNADEEPRRWQELNPCLPHADYVFDCLFNLGDGWPQFSDWATVVTLGSNSLLLRRAEGLGSVALQGAQRNVSLAKQRLGGEHLNTLAAMDDLADMLWNQGDLAAARALSEEVIGIRSRVQGAEHSDTLTSMSILALTLDAQHHFPEARALNEKVLEGYRRELGAEHPFTLTLMNNLAETLQMEGDLIGARQMHEEELEVQRRVRGPEHPETLNSMHNLAGVLYEQKFFSQARELEGDVLKVRRRVVGAKHPDTSSTARTLFRILQDLGELDAAQAILDSDLLWLLDRDPVSLDAPQREIQEYIRNIKGYRLTPPA